MARLFLISATVVLLTAALAQAAPVRILPLGDSITRGFGSVDSGGYRRPLYHRLVNAGWEVDFVGSLAHGSFPDPWHEGHDGAYIRVIRDQWAVPSQQAYDPHITLLMAGTNDVWTGTGPNAPANAPANLSSLIGTIFQANPDTKLYVASIPQIWDGHQGVEYQSVRTYNAQLPGVVQHWADQGKFVRFVDVYPVIANWELVDGVHPSDAGYADIAEVFFRALTAPSRSKINGPRWNASVPEPASHLALLLAAGAGAVARHRRR
jgi:lysophospholipase L1-like esterase